MFKFVKQYVSYLSDLIDDFKSTGILPRNCVFDRYSKALADHKDF